jgi:Protein of unknown function (DUF2877)
MQICVASLDCYASDLLDGGGSWELVGHFERALILARNPDGALISVVRHDVPDGPYTVRLDRSAPRDLRVLDAPPLLDRGSAVRWVVELVPPRDAVEHGELARRLAVLDLIADRASGSRGGWDAAISPFDLTALETALAWGDSSTAADVAAAVAGLGPGLTPSGDDLLAGALAMHAWAEAAGLIAGGGPLRLAIWEAVAPRTTRLGSQLLGAAVTGEVATPLAALLTSLFRRVATFPPDLAPLLAVGATSGADLLAGVRLAGRALRSRVREGAPA